MILDDIRARYPAIGIAVFAMEPGQPVTVESYVNGQIFSFTGATADAALTKAFPEMVRPSCPNTGLPCVPGCDQKSCAGMHVPLNEWPDPAEAEAPAPEANVFD